MFGLLLFAGIRIAVRAPDTFGRFLAAGVTAWIGLQTIVNLGAVTGVLPITGVPLPLVSFGGTALVVTLAGIGVLASVARSGARKETARSGARKETTRAFGRAHEDEERRLQAEGAHERACRHRPRGRAREGRAMNVVIAGGGTAGHVFPAVALADRLAASGDAVSFIGSPQGQEATLVPAAGYRFHAVAAAPMKREVSVATAKAPFVAAGSVRSCMPLVRPADVVVGVGGYVERARGDGRALGAPPDRAARTERHPEPVEPRLGEVRLGGGGLVRIVTGGVREPGSAPW